jgi:hypothetical protein
MYPVHNSSHKSFAKRVRVRRAEEKSSLKSRWEQSFHSLNILNKGMQDCDIKEMKGAAKGRSEGLGDTFLHPQ